MKWICPWRLLQEQPALGRGDGYHQLQTSSAFPRTCDWRTSTCCCMLWALSKSFLSWSPNLPRCEMKVKRVKGHSFSQFLKLKPQPVLLNLSFFQFCVSLTSVFSLSQIEPLWASRMHAGSRHSSPVELWPLSYLLVRHQWASARAPRVTN